MKFCAHSVAGPGGGFLGRETGLAEANGPQAGACPAGGAWPATGIREGGQGGGRAIARRAPGRGAMRGLYAAAPEVRAGRDRPARSQDRGRRICAPRGRIRPEPD